MKVLVANLGSTSFKYRLFDLPETAGSTGGERELARGGVERIGAADGRDAIRRGPRGRRTARRDARRLAGGGGILAGRAVGGRDGAD